MDIGQIFMSVAGVIAIVNRLKEQFNLSGNTTFFTSLGVGVVGALLVTVYGGGTETMALVKAAIEGLAIGVTASGSIVAVRNVGLNK